MGQYGITWALELGQEKPSENRGLAILRRAMRELGLESMTLGLEISGTNREFVKHALMLVNAALTFGSGSPVRAVSPVP